MGIHAQRDFVSASYMPLSASGNLLSISSLPTVASAQPLNPYIGQIWFDESNIFLPSSQNVLPADVITNTSRWLAYGFGYTTGATYTAVSGAMRINWATPVGGTTQFSGVSSSVSLTPGNTYLYVATVNNQEGNADICLTVGFKSSAEWLTHNGTDFILMMSFVADGNSAVFGIESVGATSKYTDVKSMMVYQINQRGYPIYVWNGSAWESVLAESTKIDILSRVNTYGNQTIGGIKTFSDGIVITSASTTVSGVRNITVSASAATGGVDGDIWLRYI